MKKYLVVLLSVFVLLSSAKAFDPYSDENLGGTPGLACEAMLCLSALATARGLPECAEALAKYFSIRIRGLFGTKWGATKRARQRFLSLCPTVDEESVVIDLDLISDIDNTVPDAVNPEVDEILDQQAFQDAGIIWKPVSELNGNLVVITPSASLQAAAIFGPDGNLIEVASNGGVRNGGRRHYRFNHPGSYYPPGSTIVIGDRAYTINNGGDRIN